MKIKFIFFLIFSLNIFLYAEQMAQIEAFEKQEIKSEVSGKIKFLDTQKEFSIIKDKEKIIEVDSYDEKLALNNLENRLLIQKEIYAIRKRNYENKAKVTQISIYDKGLEKINYLSLKESIENIKKEIRSNKKTIERKKFYVKNSYIGKIYKKSNEYIQAGEKVFDLYDFSKLRIEIYFKEKELKDIRKKTIYINGKKSKFYIWKISKIKDSKRVSKYKVILLKDNKNLENQIFNQIVTVELEDEKNI